MSRVGAVSAWLKLNDVPSKSKVPSPPASSKVKIVPCVPSKAAPDVTSPTEVMSPAPALIVSHVIVPPVFHVGTCPLDGASETSTFTSAVAAVPSKKSGAPRPVSHKLLSPAISPNASTVGAAPFGTSKEVAPPASIVPERAPRAVVPLESVAPAKVGVEAWRTFWSISKSSFAPCPVSTVAKVTPEDVSTF